MRGIAIILRLGVSHPRPRLPIRWSTDWLCLIMEESQPRFSRPRTRTSIRVNAVRSRPETDGIVGESNLAKIGGTHCRYVSPLRTRNKLHSLSYPRLKEARVTCFVLCALNDHFHGLPCRSPAFSRQRSCPAPPVDERHLYHDPRPAPLRPRPGQLALTLLSS
jgi:hypothetical protein